MTISWVSSDGQVGIAENAYEFAMQHSNTSTKGDREELAPQDRINQAFGEGPAAPDIKDQNAPYSWGMGEDIKGLGVQPDAPADEWQKSYGDKRAGEFIPISAEQNKHHGIFTPSAKALDFENQPHLYNEEATKFMEDRGAKPGDTVSEGGKTYRYLGPDPKVHGGEHNFVPVKSIVPSDQVAGWRGQLASFQQRLEETPPEEAGAFRKFLGSLNIMPAPGKPESEWTAKEHFGVLLNTAMAGMGGGIRVPRTGGVTWPEGWGTKLPEGKRILSASDYPHIQKAFKEAVEQGKSTSPEVSDYILEKHGIDLSTYMVKRLQETSGIKLEDSAVNATNSGWTPELIGKLKEGFDKGKSFQTLAADLGQSRGQIAGKVSRLLKEGVLVDRPTMTSGVEANPEKMARFKELRSKGLSYKEIAQDLNITTSYARVIASRNKL